MITISTGPQEGGSTIFPFGLPNNVAFGEVFTAPAQESPHFENGVISRLFGPHAGRKEGPKVPQ